MQVGSKQMSFGLLNTLLWGLRIRAMTDDLGLFAYRWSTFSCLRIGVLQMDTGGVLQLLNFRRELCVESGVGNGEESPP